ncbi:MAG: PAS domain S-box protein [Bryobacteraceae bacterium]
MRSFAIFHSHVLAVPASLAVIALCAGPVRAQTHVPDPIQAKSILTLYSGQFGLRGYDLANEGLLPVLRSAGIATDSVYSEYLDLVRNPNPAYRDRLAEFLKQKYADRKIGVIVAISTSAASLVLDERYRLFEGVPVIAALPSLTRMPNPAIHPLVFLGNRYDIAGTLKDALDVLPETENVLVVNGTSESDRNQERSAREQLKPWDARLRIAYLSDLPVEEILRRAAAPPPKTVILYLGLFQDVTGRSFITDDFARELGRSAAAPIFSIQDGWMDAGIVGGSMTSFREDGAEAGRMALRILNGEPLMHVPPAVIPVASRHIFQWQQLKRWGLKESKLPLNSVVLGKPVPIWRQHPQATLATFVFVVLQSGLIVALLWQRRQKRAATELLRKSEEKFRRFFTDVPDYCYIADADGAIRDANRAALAVLGYTREDLIGRPWRSILVPPIPPQVERLVEQWRQTGDVRNEEITLLSKEGVARTVLLNAAAVRDAAGAVLFSTAVLTDITERKQAEEALRQNEALLKKAEEIGQFGSWSWDVLTDTTIWSEGLYRIVGRDPGQPALRYAERAPLHTPDSWARLDSALKRALASGEPYDLEVELVRPDGVRRWARAMGAPVRDATGRVVRLHGTAQDITARKRAADALQESEESFRTAFESAAIGMGLVAPDGRWTRVNRSLCQIVGYPAEELLATDFQSITHPEDLPSNMDLLRQMLDGAIPGYQMEKRYIHKQGRIVWVYLSVALVRDASGEPLYAIAQVQDITERKEAERKLLREKAFTDAVIDNVPGLFYLLDERGKAVRWNRRAEETTGYSPDDGSHMEPTDYFPGADRAFISETMRKVFREGHAELEANLVMKNGAVIPFYFSAARVSFEGENYLLGNGIDISARKEAEKALRVSEEKFATAFRNSPVILSISTLQEGRYLEVNATFERITGWHAAEVVGRLRDEVSIRTAEARREAAARIRSSGGYRNMECEFHTKSGELRIARVSAETIEFAGEACVLTVGQDITEQKAFERELRTLNETLEKRVKDRTAELQQAVEDLQMLSQAVENGPASVMIADPQGNIEYVNPKFCENTGYPKAEVIGRKANLLKSGTHSPEFFQHLWLTIQGGETWRGEFCNRKKNGDVYWESACISTVRDAQGHARHFVAITEDITELKQAAQELQRAKEAADAASQAKTAFLASMSHEIRTPMHAILGYSQLMLRDDTISPETKENLRIVNRSGEHLLALINDVLEMSKIESGRLQLDLAEFELPSLLGDLAAMFQLRSAAKGIDLTVLQDDHMPRRVVADEGKLRQILINLLGNAVKFTAAGRITLRAMVRHDPSDHALLSLEVEDTGVGIAPAEIGKLFRPFEQTSSGRQAQSGTGLGLAISMEYARLMGGGISVASELGKGSTFRVEIPFAPAGSEQVTPSLSPDALADLPIALMAEMREAILTGDMDRFTRALPEVAERNPSAADNLRQMADRYDYDSLAQLLR